MNCKILLVIILFPINFSFASTSWILVSDTGNAREFIDFSTVQRKGSLATAWVLGDLNEPRSFKGKIFRSLKTQVEFDCSIKSFRQIHATLYSGQMGAGNVLESGYVKNPWEPAVPQSVGQKKLQAVCR